MQVKSGVCSERIQQPKQEAAHLQVCGQRPGRLGQDRADHFEVRRQRPQPLDREVGDAHRQRHPAAFPRLARIHPKLAAATSHTTPFECVILLKLIFRSSKKPCARAQHACTSSSPVIHDLLAKTIKSAVHLSRYSAIHSSGHATSMRAKILVLLSTDKLKTQELCLFLELWQLLGSCRSAGRKRARGSYKAASMVGRSRK